MVLRFVVKIIILLFKRLKIDKNEAMSSMVLLKNSVKIITFKSISFCFLNVYSKYADNNFCQ